MHRYGDGKRSYKAFGCQRCGKTVIFHQMPAKGVWKCAACIKRLGVIEEKGVRIQRDNKRNKKVSKNNWPKQTACPGCGELKDAYDLERRKHGTSKCHSCVKMLKEKMPPMRVAAKAARKIIKKQARWPKSLDEKKITQTVLEVKQNLDVNKLPSMLADENMSKFDKYWHI
jgi:ribosomal protein L37AE/L43A